MREISKDRLNEICQMGQGENCCRYITMIPGRGFCCAKGDPTMKTALDAQAASGRMRARGDNCGGSDALPN